MKTIIAKIEKDVVMIDPTTPTDIQITETPAYKNWDKLRALGYVTCRLIDEPVTDELNWHLPETDLERLEIEIATYDWYYEMSDDIRVWKDGQDKDSRIENLANKVGKEVYKELWKAYVERASTKFIDPTRFIKTFMERAE